MTQALISRPVAFRAFSKYGKILVNKANNLNLKRVNFLRFYSFFVVIDQFQRIGAENL